MSAHDVGSECMTETKCRVQGKTTFAAVGNGYENYAHLSAPLTAKSPLSVCIFHLPTVLLQRCKAALFAINSNKDGSKGGQKHLHSINHLQQLSIRTDSVINDTGYAAETV